MSSCTGEWWVGGRKWIQAENWAPMGGDAGGAERCQDPEPCRQHSGPGPGMLINLFLREVLDGQEGQVQGKGPPVACPLLAPLPAFRSPSPQGLHDPLSSNQRGSPSSGSSSRRRARAPGRENWGHPGNRSPEVTPWAGTNAERWDRPLSPGTSASFPDSDPYLASSPLRHQHPLDIWGTCVDSAFSPQPPGPQRLGEESWPPARTPGSGCISSPGHASAHQVTHNPPAQSLRQGLVSPSEAFN